MEEVGIGSELESKSVEKKLEAEAIFSKSGSSGFSNSEASCNRWGKICNQGRIQDSPLGGAQFLNKCKLFLLEAGVGGPGAPRINLGSAPSRRRPGGLGAEPPEASDFLIFHSK